MRSRQTVSLFVFDETDNDEIHFIEDHYSDPPRCYTGPRRLQARRQAGRRARLRYFAGSRPPACQRRHYGAAAAEGRPGDGRNCAESDDQRAESLAASNTVADSDAQQKPAPRGDDATDDRAAG